MNEKQCPYCREWIPQELSFCPYCMESMEAKKKIKSPIRKRRVTLLVLNTLVLVLSILCIWLYCNRRKEPYSDYTGQWNGEQSPFFVDLKIEGVKNGKLNGYLILSEGSYNVLETAFSGEIKEDGIVSTVYETGNETGRIQLELKNRQLEISVYQTEVTGYSSWEHGRLKATTLWRKETSL